jgi:replicative DNA helicase
MKEIKESLKDSVLNPGSERNLLSICLKNSEKIIDVEASEIFAEHFGISGHKYIFMAVMYLYSKKLKPTPMAIMEVLSGAQSKKAVEDLGGLEYLMMLEESTVPEGNLPIFIEKVKQSYTRRMLLDIADDMMALVTSDRANVLNPTELLAFAEEKINNLAVTNSNTENVYKMGDKTEEVLEFRSKNPSQVPGIEVGWTQYDRLTNGAQPGDLIVLVAPSKVGKSVTLTNWATNLAIKDQIPILYIDTEMNEREQEDRILANLTGIPHSEIVSGLYVVDTVHGKADDKVARLKSARESLKMGSYYHIYLPHFTIEKVTALARKFATQFGIKALFFDYIKIPSNMASFKTMQEYQALGFFTSGLKDLAGILKIPIFTAAQANRNDTETENPDASNIGGSYRILQLASKLMFLVNKTEERIARDGFINGNQQLIIKYQRNGESDCAPINIMFDKPILRQDEC